MIEEKIGNPRYCSFETNYPNCMQDRKDFGKDEDNALKHIKGWLDYMLRGNLDYSMKSKETHKGEKKTYVKTLSWKEYGCKYWAKWTFKNFK